MCAGDATLVPVRVDVDSPLGAVPVFSNRHVCRDFEKLRGWAEVNGVPGSGTIDVAED